MRSLLFLIPLAAYAECPPTASALLGAMFRAPNAELHLGLPTGAKPASVAATVRARVQLAGGFVKTSEPATYQARPGLRVVAHLPGGQVPAGLLSPGVLAFHPVDETAKLREGPLAELQAQAKAPVNGRIWGFEGPHREGGPHRPWSLLPAALTAAQVDHCSASAVQSNHGPLAVQLRFTKAGAVAFHTLTKGLVGKHLAIVVDGEVLSAPVVREAIGGGSLLISMGQHGDAKALAARLGGGRLPIGVRLLDHGPPKGP